MATGEKSTQQVAFVAQRSNALIKELEQKQADVTATLDELKDIHRQCLRYLTEISASGDQAGALPNAPDGLKKARRSHKD